ncbi:MAG: TonB-dependent receptor [Pyrinomonadaceae bacterium]|nr:TonB-dependent receptor [Pyrinomonadaceae bacterium]
MRKMLLLICLMCSLGSAAYGQTGGAGQIAGQVVDPSSKVIVGAKVTATNVETNAKTEAITTDEGNYQLLQLSPGLYRLDVEATGFKTVQRPDTRVQVADRLTIDFPLEVGLGSETVTITEQAPLLRTQDAQTGEVINQEMIQNLPQLNRDPLQLLVLSGNVQGGGDRATGDSDTRINGGRTHGIEYYVDGITAGTGRSHGVSGVVTPTMEAVNEFKVITNGISAEYGRISGGAVDLVSRSGTNGFHGQVFDYVKNDILNANSFDQNRRGGKKPVFRNNIFGLAIGGPVYLPRFGEGGPSVYSGRDRTFFFFNYEGTRFVQKGALRTASVPTAEMREGDFTNVFVFDARTQLFDPFGQIGPNQERLTLLGGDGKRVPANRISPVSRAILQLVPLPNRAPDPGTSYFNNYAAPVDEQRNQDTWALRLDHAFTENSRIFGRYSRLNNDFQESRWRGPAQAVPNSFVKGGFGTTISYDWAISPTLLFNARVGGHYNPRTSGSTLAEDFSSTSIPFDAVTRSILGPKSLPWVGATFHGNLTDNPSFGVENSTTFNTSASMVKILNRHSLKFGYEHRRYYDNYFNSGGGEFVFQQNPVGRFAKDDSWNNQDATNVLGAFLLGINDKARLVADTTRAMNVNYHGAYVQDDFKVSQKLTLNLGLRWDMETPTTERNDKLYLWDPDAPSQFTIKPGYSWAAALAAATDLDGNPKPLTPGQVRAPEWLTQGFPNGALRIANTPEFPSRNGTKFYPGQFAPRLGLAYQVNDKTVVRASAGKMYLSTTGDPNGLASGGSGVPLSDSADAGWHANDNYTFRNVISNFEQPFQPRNISRYSRNTAVANFQGTGGDPAPIAYNRNSRQPVEYTWGVGVQRELPSQFLLEVNYAANRGSGLLGPDVISHFPKELFTPANREIYGTTLVESPVAEPTKYDLRPRLAFLEYPYPYYGPVVVLGTNLGRSNYQSLNVRAERRLGSGYSFLVNYTLSRAYDNVGGPNVSNGGITASGTGVKQFQSVDTLRDVYGISPLDERHRLVVYYNLQFPVGRGRRFLGSPDGFPSTILDYVVGGWELAGISQWRSGRPIVLNTANTNTNNDIRVERTFGSFASSDRDLSGSSFGGSSGVFIVGGDPTSIPASARRLDPSKVITAQTFTYGDLPSVYDGVRQPSKYYHDISLMKKFPIFSRDGTRYLQIRMEGQNIFNMRGFGDYDTTVGSSTYGLITGAGYGPRQIQVSARIVF